MNITPIPIPALPKTIRWHNNDDNDTQFSTGEGIVNLVYDVFQGVPEVTIIISDRASHRNKGRVRLCVSYVLLVIPKDGDELKEAIVGVYNLLKEGRLTC